MSSNRPSEFSSPFDAMLAESRRQFDALYGDSAPPRAEVPTPSVPEPAVSASARTLNERYGGGWRHEITERRREDDEAVVLCRLTITESGSVKAQFGRAPMGTASGVGGTAGGVAFRTAAPTGADSEAAAFAAAEEAALAKCVAML